MKSDLIITSTDGMTPQQWLQFRTRGLGASDIGAVLGFSEYCSPMQKFDEKISLNPKPKFENLAMFLGKRAETLNAQMWEFWDGTEEGMIANYYANRKIRRCRKVNAYIQNPKYNWLFVSLDRVINKHERNGVKYGEGALELKNLSSYEVQKWETGIPTSYLLQVQTQLLVCGLEYGELSIKQDDRKFTVYEFEKNKEICDQIIEQTFEFWQKVEEARKIQTQIFEAKQNYNQRAVEELQIRLQELEPDPDGTDAVSDFLSEKYKRSIGQREGNAQEFELAVKHLSKKEELKQIETEVKLYENKLKNAMKNAEVLTFGKRGAIHWSEKTNGGRVFRNKIKL